MHTSLKRTRTKGCQFWLDWNCSEAFEKLELYMNSAICLNNFDIPLLTLIRAITLILKYVKNKENVCDYSFIQLYIDLLKVKALC